MLKLQYIVSAVQLRLDSMSYHFSWKEVKQTKVRHNTFSEGNVNSINNVIGAKNMPPNCKQQKHSSSFSSSEQKKTNNQPSKQWFLLRKARFTLKTIQDYYARYCS
jgi:hypothetical protein